MKQNFKFILTVLAVLLIPAIIVLIVALGGYYGHFGPLQYLFSSDANAVWNPITNYTGDIGRPLWPDFSLFLPTSWQAIVSIVLLVIAVVLTWLDPKNQTVRVAAMALAVVTIVRHLTWRGLYTIDTVSTANAVVGVIVYLAEVSAFIALLLGYFQMFNPKPEKKFDISKIPEEDLPNVDILITTINEGIDILYRGVVGALNVNYPKKKVYVLDDGNRPEVKELCNQLGCKYITRESCEHAKAGNLNNALKYTDGELVAIFDADYIPTYDFLNDTVGFFINEKDVAYVQTPQHFFTPDPFQRNLLVERTVTNEQDLFYHVIQPGNNYWHSAFFAGSSAIFRRTALDAIGGFAIETITEDTHTGIRLHSKKYKSYYYGKMISAGLAQESFHDYLNQRLRWGRGMFQILRYDNPLFVKGLKLPQRLCYFAGIYYFFNGLPRLIFLAAPLCFLIVGLKPIDAGIIEMIIYYAPSFIITILSFSIITNGVRQTFWSEVYESATALFLFITTTTAMVSPSRARFRVTPKGTISSETTFDWNIVTPQLVLGSLTFIGLVLGIVRIIVTPDYIGGILPNLFWGSYNMVLMVGAIIVASNRPQYRTSPRIFRKVRCELGLIDGTFAVGYTTNISETGLSMVFEKPVPVSDVVTLRITDPEIKLNTTITAQVIRSSVDQKDRHYLGLRLINRTEQQHQNLVRHMFTAPDIWEGDIRYEKKTSKSLLSLVSTAFRWSSTEEIPFHRVAPRFDKLLSCVVKYDNQSIIGYTSEISETGAALKLRAPVKVNIGQNVIVRIQWQDGKVTEVPAEVSRLIKAEEDSILMGVKFKGLSLEEKLNIIIHLYDAGHDIVRVAPNFRRTLSCVIIKGDSPTEIPGYTFEISETELSISLKKLEFKKDEIVKVILQWEDRTKQEIYCTVKNIYDDGENYLVRLAYHQITSDVRKVLIDRLYQKLDDAKLYTTKS